MKTLILLLTLSFSLTCVAETKTTGIVGGGFAFGGDAIVEDIQFEDGSTDDVDAGEGIWIDLGMRFDFSSWALKSTIGYKSGGTFASNGDATLSRIPLTFIASYNNNGHYFGGGFTHELNPTLDLDLPYFNGSADFDNTTGLVIEYENNYDRWAWGIRYTDIEYSHSDSSMEYDGSNIGAFAHFYF